MQAKDLRSKKLKLRCGASSPRRRGDEIVRRAGRRRAVRTGGRRLFFGCGQTRQPPPSRHCRSIFSFSFLQHSVPSVRASAFPVSSLATLLCVLGVCVRSAPAWPDERRRPCVTRSAERSVHVAAGHEPVNVHRGTNSTFGSLRSCEREQLPCEARRSLPAHCAACARVRGALHSTAGLTFLQTGRAWLAASRSSSPLA